MKKLVLSALLFSFAANTLVAVAHARPCRVWKKRHHHLVCVRH